MSNIFPLATRPFNHIKYMQTITLEEANSMGFIEKSYRPWIKGGKFMIQSSKKWTDLLQRRESSVVYLATIPNDHTK